MSDEAKVVSYWFDYSSPFAYLGATQVEAVAASAGARVRFEPFLLGALFKAIGAPLVPILTFTEAKQRHVRMDLYRHADAYGVPFVFPTRFPLRTVDALRLTLLAEHDARPALVHRLMRAAWAEDLDVAEQDVLRTCARDAGLDPALAERVSAPEAKAMLHDATDRARALSLPGAPSCVVGEHVYWGQDRLDFVRRALLGAPPAEGPAQGPAS